MTKSLPLVVALTLAALAAFGGCAGDETKSVPTSECASGTKWVGGNDGSERMHPGRGCVGCHASNDGPNFTLAGTVFGADGQADECFGVGGVTIEITDANGAVTTLTANEAGNFHTKAGIAVPFTAKVRSAAGERVMTTPQSSGDCNTCHSPQGRNGAPGRILAP
jgi:mono/diheme cytochrome c family protein